MRPSLGTYLDGAVFAAGLQSENPQRFRDNHALLPVVGRGDTLIELETGNGGGTTGGFVGNHATDSLEENARWCPEMEWTGLFRVHDVALVEEVVVAKLALWNRRLVLCSGLLKSSQLTHLVPEERAADVDFLAPHDNDLLTGEDLLGDDRRKAAEEVALAIDHHWGRGEGGHNSE